MRYITLLLLLTFTRLYGFNDEPGCFRELQTTFFQTDLVQQALSLNAIDMNTWPLITQELQRRSQTIPSILRERTRFMRPDPLDYPFDPIGAGEILRQILFQMFTDVFHDFRTSSGLIVNDYDIQNMFNFIRYRQRDRITQCLGEGAMEPPKNNPSQ